MQALFDLANIATQEKIKPIKMEFWQDERQQDAIATFSFQGWIAGFHLDGGGGVNHILHLSLQPALDSSQYINLMMGN